MRKILIFALLLLLSGAAFAYDVRDGEARGRLKIVNETEIDMYIVINGYNQGRVSSRSSKEFSVPLGEVRIQAEYGDNRVIREYKTVSRGSAAEWTINDDEVEYRTKGKGRYDPD